MQRDCHGWPEPEFKSRHPDHRRSVALQARAPAVGMSGDVSGTSLSVIHSVRPAPLMLAAMLLAGCSSSPGSDVEQAVEDFGIAWEARDGAAVCALLAPVTQREVESTTGLACAKGVLELDVQPPGAVTDVRVFATAAQVRTEADTVFLSQYDGGWRVLAASCEPQGEQPYDCQLKGA